jgi:hypothetical protein
MIIYRFNDSGRYTLKVHTNAEGLAHENRSRICLTEVDMVTQYHDLETGLPKNKGEQPSAHHEFDYTTKQWVDPRTLEEIKDAKWIEIKVARSAAEYGGFMWDSSTFDSDALSQQKIMGAVQMAALTSAFEIDWTLADNTVRALNAAEMTSVGAALGQHVNTQYVTARVRREQIQAAQTQAEVESIAW